MADNNNWIEPFRTQSRLNVYVLTVSIVECGIDMLEVREVIDCPKGELGVRYAHNILSRLSNEILMGTDFEKMPWERFNEPFPNSIWDFQYVKWQDDKNRVKASMEWFEKMPNGGCKRHKDKG